MAKLNISTSNALAKKLWVEKLIREIPLEGFFAPMMGTDSSSLVHQKTDLEKSSGDNITFGLKKRLTGAGVTGNQILENNEERIQLFSDSVSLELYRHAVRDEGKLNRKRPAFNVTEEQRDAIKTWGSEKIDGLCFDAAFGSFTSVGYLNGSGVFTVGAEAAAKAAMSATNSKITPAYVSAMRVLAKEGQGRAQEPLLPIKWKGKDYYVMLVNNEVIYDMKQNSVFTNAWTYAQERGEDNPLFRSAELIWDGVVILGNERVPKADDGGGSTVHYSKGIFCGAQSLIWAWGEKPYMVEDEFDYKNEMGISYNMICGVKKPSFNSKNYGSFGVYCAATKIG